MLSSLINLCTMDREKLIADIYENITSLERLMFARGPHSQIKGMPSHAQLRILFVIFHKGPQSIKFISEKFGISPSAVTQLVDNLVLEKLLVRKEDAEDRRKICLELTSLGKKKIQEAQKLRFEKIKSMFDPLTNDELSQLKSIYSKITDNLR